MLRSYILYQQFESSVNENQSEGQNGSNETAENRKEERVKKRNVLELQEHNSLLAFQSSRRFGSYRVETERNGSRSAEEKEERGRLVS